MRSVNVIVAHNDPVLAQDLASSLRGQFSSVCTAITNEELESAIVHKHIGLAVVDLDLIGLDQVRELRDKFGICIICIHRIPDETMWIAALERGAIDCCQTTDVRSIIQAARKDFLAHSHAA